MATNTDFAQWIASTLRALLTEDEDGFAFTLRLGDPSGGASSALLSFVALEAAIAKLQALGTIQDVILFGPRTYEAPLKDVGAYARMRLHLRDSSLRIEDRENDIVYEIGSPSDEYILFLLQRLHEKGGPMLANFNRATFLMARRGPLDGQAFDAVRRALRSLFTVKLVSERSRSVTDFDGFTNSLLFNFSYNLDSPLVRHQNLADVVSLRRIVRLRSAKPSDLDPPRRHYVPDLVNHYQLALSVDSPSLQYLSYYHIAEHFFEEVFNEDVIGHVREMLTTPHFSYKRKADLAGLIKLVSKRIKIRDERVGFSEQEALRLVLAKFVDLTKLKEELARYGTNLIPYLASTKVGFASADIVDLEDVDEAKTQKSLAKRIYLIRNAIVHSKESEKSKYTPFHDDEALVNDLMLIRFIAEQIVVSSSQVI